MEQIITDIKLRLATKIPALKYIAKNWGQLNSYFGQDTAHPVRFPCTLIHIPSAQFSNLGAQIQEGLLQVIITIACAPTGRVSSKAPQAMQDKELEIYRLAQQVYQALHGWTGGANYSALIRTTYSETIREDGIQEMSVSFTSNWQDTSAMPQPAVVNKPTPVVAVALRR